MLLELDIKMYIIIIGEFLYNFFFGALISKSKDKFAECTECKRNMIHLIFLKYYHGNNFAVLLDTCSADEFKGFILEFILHL